MKVGRSRMVKEIENEGNGPIQFAFRTPIPLFMHMHAPMSESYTMHACPDVKEALPFIGGGLGFSFAIGLSVGLNPLVYLLKKEKLAYITNDAARKTTYKKRVKGLVKKVIELTTLCGIEEACAVFYSPTCES
ncbi:hypothetical protein V6N12_004212 [Hibiscus sabdariffa]|uniref:MADS-box domain-containing protein n=1 Tax=Hibiscus sabdariffa TaxID=183260 RepID=A0ABR2CKS9_9ROSI